MDVFQRLLNFLSEMERQNIFFTLARTRPDTVMVNIRVPGEYWEVEFFADGQIEVEVFTSRAGVEGVETLAELFARHSDEQG
jgi:hypothetical protein